MIKPRLRLKKLDELFPPITLFLYPQLSFLIESAFEWFNVKYG
jgi:hypothetical protein